MEEISRSLTNTLVYKKCLQTEHFSRGLHEEAVSTAYTVLIIVLWIL